MTSMVERVARALALYRHGAGGLWTHYVPEARAAIAAMQEAAVGWAYEKYDEGGGIVDAVFRDALEEKR